jgi:hypothetical protein
MLLNVSLCLEKKKSMEMCITPCVSCHCKCDRDVCKQENKFMPNTYIGRCYVKLFQFCITRSGIKMNVRALVTLNFKRTTYPNLLFIYFKFPIK